jgi:hypothetical protein
VKVLATDALSIGNVDVAPRIVSIEDWLGDRINLGWDALLGHVLVIDGPGRQLFISEAGPRPRVPRPSCYDHVIHAVEKQLGPLDPVPHGL